MINPPHSSVTPKETQMTLPPLEAQGFRMAFQGQRKAFPTPGLAGGIRHRSAGVVVMCCLCFAH